MRTSPEEHPKSEKKRATSGNKAGLCKSNNIAIRSLKWNALSQVLFKLTF